MSKIHLADFFVKTPFPRIFLALTFGPNNTSRGFLLAALIGTHLLRRSIASYTVRNAHGIFIICGNFTHVIGGCLPSLEGCNVNHDPDGKFTMAII
jgi:hypothetical protein